MNVGESETERILLLPESDFTEEGALEDIYGINLNAGEDFIQKESKLKSKKRDTKKLVRRLVFQKKKKGKYFNMKDKNVPLSRRYIDLYHYVLDLEWYKVFVLFLLNYITVHTIFGLLYFVDVFFEKSSITRVSNSYSMIYIYCFFFSMNVLNTVGTFGIIVPRSIYSRCVVTFESFFSYFFTVLWISLLYGKFGRPSKMKKNILFSKNAVFHKFLDKEVNLDLKSGNDEYVFCFRYSNIRGAKSPIQSIFVDLLLLIWTDDRDFNIYHLDYDVYDQTEIIREIEFSRTVLPIPQIVYHKITEESPLYDFFLDSNLEKLKEQNLSFEIVCVFEGIDSATSLNYQTYFSWTEVECFFNHDFEPCCYYSSKKSRFVVDYKKFHKVKMVASEVV